MVPCYREAVVIVITIIIKIMIVGCFRRPCLTCEAMICCRYVTVVRHCYVAVQTDWVTYHGNIASYIHMKKLGNSRYLVLIFIWNKKISKHFRLYSSILTSDGSQDRQVYLYIHCKSKNTYMRSTELSVTENPGILY